MNRIAIFALAAVLGAGLSGPAAAATLKDGHDFCRGPCYEGEQSTAALTAGPDGTYYGTTTKKGRNSNAGTVFAATLSGSKWAVKSIYSFCRQTDCNDGGQPQGGLVADTAGNLYGMTTVYGSGNAGTIFKLSKVGSRWKYRVIHSFCAELNCTDGGAPTFSTLSYEGAETGAAYDGTSPLYGTVPTGGSADAGVVFALTPHGGRFNYSVVYNFCSQANCTDGAMPYTGVTVDASGNLFGTDALGGVSIASNMCCGVLYKLTPNGASWTFSALHSFCSKMSGGICTDGREPFAPPTIDAMGNIFGTAYQGGANDMGTAYEFSPGTAKFAVLHNFCAETDCTDGTSPYVGKLALGASGELYGTAVLGGPMGGGEVFKLMAKHLSVIGAFNGANGQIPMGGPVIEPSGNLLGTTQYGGTYSNGVLYELTP